jgi:hypothetical protein
MVTKIGSKDEDTVIKQLRYDLSCAMYDYIINDKDSLIDALFSLEQNQLENVLDTYINGKLDNMAVDEMLEQLEHYTGTLLEFSK